MSSSRAFDGWPRTRLAHESAVGITIRICGAAFGFLFNVLLARKLGKDATGTVLFYLNFATMCGLIATAGMDTVGLRELSIPQNDRDATAAIFGRLLANLLVSAFLFSLVGFGFLLVFGVLHSSIWICVASALTLVLTAIQKSFSDWLVALQRYSASQLCFYLINRLVAVVLLGLTFMVSSATTDSLYFCVLAYGAGLVAAVFFASGQVFSRVDFRVAYRGFTPSLQFVRDGIACGTQNAAFIALNLSPLLLLGLLSNASELGLFAVSQRLLALMVLVETTISQLAMREFAGAWARREGHSLALALTGSVRVTIATSAGITIAMLAFSHFWVSIFGHGFAAAAPVLVSLSLGVFAQCVGMPFQSALLGTHNERAARTVTVLSAAVGVLVELALIRHWGALGATIGAGVGLALQSAGHGAVVLERLPVRLEIWSLGVVPRPGGALNA